MNKKEENKILKVVRKMVDVFETLVLVSVLFIVGFFAPTTWKALDLTHQGYETTETFFDLQPLVVLSNSMKGDKTDNFSAGDVVMTTLATAEEVEPGDVVVYSLGNKKDRSWVIHRLIEKYEDGTMLFKGDANNETDLNLVTPDQIVAKYDFKIEGIGWFINSHWVKKVVYVCIGIAAYTLIHLIIDSDERKADDELYELKEELKEIDAKLEKTSDDEKRKKLLQKRTDIAKQINELLGIEIPQSTKIAENHEVKKEVIVKPVEQIRPEIKAAIDSYENYYLTYLEVSIERHKNIADEYISSKYDELKSKATEMSNKLRTLKNIDLTPEEKQYFELSQERIKSRRVELESKA